MVVKIRKEPTLSGFSKYVTANENINISPSGKLRTADLGKLQESYREHNVLQNKLGL